MELQIDYNTHPTWCGIGWLATPEYTKFWAKHACRLLELSPNNTLLDAGCGDAAVISKMGEIIDPNTAWVGIDISEGMARRWPSECHPKLSLHQTEFIENDIGTFDRILMKQVVHHMGETEEALSAVELALNPGGICLILTMPSKCTFPSFPSMDESYSKSVANSDTIINAAISFGLSAEKEKISFPTTIKKADYFEMLRERFTSPLHSLSDTQIEKGIQFIDQEYPDAITFRDSLWAIKLRKPA